MADASSTGMVKLLVAPLAEHDACWDLQKRSCAMRGGVPSGIASLVDSRCIRCLATVAWSLRSWVVVVGGGSSWCGWWWCWLGGGVVCGLFLRFSGDEEVRAENGSWGVVPCSSLGVDEITAEYSSVCGGDGVDDDVGCALVVGGVVLVGGSSPQAW